MTASGSSHPTDPTAADRVRDSGWRSRPATALIVALNLGVSAGYWALEAASPSVGNALEPWLWNTPRLVTERLWLWQLVTANFVHRGVLHLALGGHGTDRQAAPGFSDVVELAELAQIDHHGGAREPHAEQRHQTLPPGQDLGLALVGLKQ